MMTKMIMGLDETLDLTFLEIIVLKCSAKLDTSTLMKFNTLFKNLCIKDILGEPNNLKHWNIDQAHIKTLIQSASNLKFKRLTLCLQSLLIYNLKPFF